MRAEGKAIRKSLDASFRWNDNGVELDEGTLSAIIGPKQMGIGKKGLLELIDRYGL